jgi:SAM-dependent methyltransferase
VVERAERTDGLWRLVRDVVASRMAESGSRELEIVDVGGGTGQLAVPLALAGHRVTVIDPTLDSLAALERRATEAGALDRVTAIQGDAADLPSLVAAGRADVVLCHNVLEIVDDPVQAVAAITYALAPGGLLSLLAANRHAVVLAKVLTGHVDEARRALADPNGRWGDANGPVGAAPQGGWVSGAALAGELRGLRSRLVPGFLHDRGDLGVGHEALPALLIPVEDHPDPIVLGGIAKDQRALRPVLLALLRSRGREDRHELVEVLHLCRRE